MSACIRVQCPYNRSYSVRFQRGAHAKLGEYVQALLASTQTTFDMSTTVSRVCMVSDTNVAPHYMASAKQSLTSMGFHVTHYLIQAGEPSKNLKTVHDICTYLAEQGFDRHSMLVSLGGGVVSDISGFVAAIFMRGIRVVHIPTSLLAMVDASVGGKTGVNLASGKNLVGVFYQPQGVLIDVDVLQTLPFAELKSGMGEALKMAMLSTAHASDYLHTLALHLHSLQAGVFNEETLACLEKLVYVCVQEKARIVADDEHDTTGTRAFLNYGHTLGHALERVCGYGVMSHGVAVAEGARFAAFLAQWLAQQGHMVHDDALHVTSLLCSTFTSLSDFVTKQAQLLDDLDYTPLFRRYAQSDSNFCCNILEAIHHDKKAHDGSIVFILPDNKGNLRLQIVEDKLIEQALRAYCEA